jgi:uncharacterized membrane protein (UPF0127 family)
MALCQELTRPHLAPDVQQGLRLHHGGRLQPLDTAFLSHDGGLIETLTMPLCRESRCPAYGPKSALRYAIEAPRGALTGLEPTTRLEFRGVPWDRQQG